MTHALVAGGGIGGLAAAIALRQAGVEALVLEQAQSFDVAGAGLGLSSNAVAALERLGVADAVRARSASAERALVRARSGRVLAQVRYADHGWDLLGIHRADLQEILLEAAGRERVRLGARCAGFEAGGDRVRVRLEDGSAEEGDLLVGADGIESVVRDALLGPVASRYSGYAGWRAVAPLDLPELRGIVSETWGPGDRFGLVPIGGGRLYWFVSDSLALGTPAHPHPKEEFRRRFAGWHDPIPQVVEATDEAALFRTFVYDLRPLREWGRGRATLLGDAAHAMTPNLSQGAAQSLEDAVVLGQELERGGGIESALRRYEERRRKRANGLIRASRQAGSLAQRKTALGCALRDTVVRALPERVGIAQQARMVAADLD